MTRGRRLSGPRLFAAEGAKLILAARRKERLEKLAGELKTDVHLLELRWSFVMYPLGLVATVVEPARLLVVVQSLALGATVFPLWALARRIAKRKRLDAVDLLPLARQLFAGLGVGKLTTGGDDQGTEEVAPVFEVTAGINRQVYKRWGLWVDVRHLRSQKERGEVRVVDFSSDGLMVGVTYNTAW